MIVLKDQVRLKKKRNVSVSSLSQHSSRSSRKSLAKKRSSVTQLLASPNRSRKAVRFENDVNSHKYLHNIIQLPSRGQPQHIGSRIVLGNTDMTYQNVQQDRNFIINGTEGASYFEEHPYSNEEKGRRKRIKRSKSTRKKVDNNLYF